MNQEQYYPTPEDLAKEMIELVDLSGVKTVLDPSAGQGHLLDVFNEIHNKPVEVYSRNRGTEHLPPYKLHAVEINQNRRATLKGKGYPVVGSDFLEESFLTPYDLILMNPPFSGGYKHLLKAISMLERKGGQVVCLLNAMLFSGRDLTQGEKTLMAKLEKYDAKVFLRESAFVSAEVKTNVPVAIIKISVPANTAHVYSILDGVERALEREHTAVEVSQSLSPFEGTLKAFADAFEREALTWMTLYDVASKTKSQLMESTLPSLGSPITINMSEQEFLENLRWAYWMKLFDTKEIFKLMTYEMRRSIQNEQERWKQIDVTVPNIIQVQMNLQASFSDTIHGAILTAFESCTYKHSMDRDSNIHYYNGWKTNSAFKIKPKVILSAFSWRNCKGWDYGNFDVSAAKEILQDLEKCFIYLDENKHEFVDVETIMKDNPVRHYEGEKIEFEYFTCAYKKKGSLHLWFKDLELLERLNYMAAKDKSWLPKGYGTTSYENMDSEEQDVVDSYIGASKYKEVCTNFSKYQLGSISPSSYIALGAVAESLQK